MGRLLRSSINGDLTIDDRRNGAWQSWHDGGVEIPIEEVLHAMVSSARTSK